MKRSILLLCLFSLLIVFAENKISATLIDPQEGNSGSKELVQFKVFVGTTYIGFDNIQFLKTAKTQMGDEVINIDYYVFYSERYSVHYLNNPVRTWFEGEPTDYVIQGMIVVDRSGDCIYYKSEEHIKGVDGQKRTVTIQWNHDKGEYLINILDPMRLDSKRNITHNKVPDCGARIPIFSKLHSSLHLYTLYHDIHDTFIKVEGINPYHYALRRKLKSMSANSLHPDIIIYPPPDGKTWFFTVHPHLGKFEVGRSQSGRIYFPKFDAYFDD